MKNTDNQHSKWLVVVNPAACNGLCGKIYSEIIEQLRTHDFHVAVELSEYAQHITIIVKNYIESGYRYIMAIGGDGTNNEAINGIMLQTSCPSTDITYALIPVGTGNDWIRQFSIPKERYHWIQCIKTLNTQLVDVGELEFVDKNGQSVKRFFINIAGFAYDAYTVKNLESINTPSKLKYFKQVLIGLMTYRPEESRIQLKQKEIQKKLYTLNVGLGKYSGGGMQLVPHGGSNDGTFAITIAEAMHPLRVLLASAKFYNGKIGLHPKVECTNSESITVTHVEKPIGCEVDGEWVGYTPCTLKVIKNAIQIVVP